MDREKEAREKEEEEEEEDDEILNTPEPRKWECFGSDLEIVENQFQNERDLVKMTCNYGVDHHSVLRCWK